MSGEGYWSRFYAGEHSAAVPDEPSAFARWVAARHGSVPLLVDIGSGTGRDGLWFARRGQRVLGLDCAAPAVERCGRAAEAERLPAGFERFDLDQPDRVAAVGRRLAAAQRAPLLYGRFLVHALDDRARHGLWQLARMALATGGRLCVEFRTGKDAGQWHEFGEHFRTFLEADTVVDEIVAAGGGIRYRHEGHGLAVYRDEDPHVCRLEAVWASLPGRSE